MTNKVKFITVRKKKNLLIQIITSSKPSLVSAAFQKINICFVRAVIKACTSLQCLNQQQDSIYPSEATTTTPPCTPNDDLVGWLVLGLTAL